MGRNISVDHAAGPDEGILADRYAADDGTVSAERRAALHQRRTVFVLAGDSRARIVDVGKHHAGTAKHIVLKADGVVYRSEEHTSELKSLMRISESIYRLKKKKKHK